MLKSILSGLEYLLTLDIGPNPFLIFGAIFLASVHKWLREINRLINIVLSHKRDLKKIDADTERKKIIQLEKLDAKLRRRTSRGKKP